MATEIKWIKIFTNVFENEKILIIESMPDADAIIAIWFKMLCLAGKQNNAGVFVIGGSVPYTDEMFAAVFKRPIEVVRHALEVFELFSMIEVVDGVVVIPNWEKYQSVDALEASRTATRNRVAKHREKQRSLVEKCNNGNVTPPVTVTPCNEDRKEEVDEEEKKEELLLSSPVVEKANSQAEEDLSSSNDEILHNNEKPSKCAAKEPIFISLPLNDGTFYDVTQSEIDQYISLYPAVDVYQHYRNMLGWLNAKPANRKTRAGIRRFINSWLAKEQNRGGTNYGQYTAASDGRSKFGNTGSTVQGNGERKPEFGNLPGIKKL